MLKLTVPGYEYYDERTNRFGHTKDTTLQLEHSLVSLSKWEEKWNKPFLGKEPKTMEQCLDYVRCMTITQNVDPMVYNGLTNENFEQINKYIEAPMTATWFSDKDNKRFNREVITAEIIYYWMIALNIPFECQKWHLNKLLTLVRVCNIKNTPPKKRGKGMNRAVMDQRTALNRARREQMHTTG